MTRMIAGWGLHTTICSLLPLSAVLQARAMATTFSCSRSAAGQASLLTSCSYHHSLSLSLCRPIVAVHYKTERVAVDDMLAAHSRAMVNGCTQSGLASSFYYVLEECYAVGATASICCSLSLSVLPLVPVVDGFHRQRN